MRKILPILIPGLVAAFAAFVVLNELRLALAF